MDVATGLVAQLEREEEEEGRRSLFVLRDPIWKEQGAVCTRASVKKSKGLQAGATLVLVWELLGRKFSTLPQELKPKAQLGSA